MAPVVSTQDVKLCNTQLLDPIPAIIQAVALHHRHTATDFLVQFFDPTRLAGALVSYEQVRKTFPLVSQLKRSTVPALRSITAWCRNKSRVSALLFLEPARVVQEVGGDPLDLVLR